MSVSNDALLELHCAARPFIDRRSLKDLEARARLRRAIIAVLRQRGAVVPPALINTAEEALDSLRALLRRCDELKVNWTDIVAIVNREEKELA
ncbi:MAG TPA: hypothetical protein VGF92_02825 [Stellaceae bacterium]|jgi:hypothetical protein